MGSIERFCDAMRWAADSDRVGYSQSDRWNIEFYGDGLYNADCSSLVIAAAKHAGFDTAGASYTGNMSAAFCSRGWERLSPREELRPGDILLNDASHVAVWLGDCLAQASRDENGRYVGGRPGDQDGGEVNTRSLYDYPWDCILRWVQPERPKEDADLKRVANDGGDVRRLYNPNDGQHHFTIDAEEAASLAKAGWKDEGVAWRAPKGGTVALYRLYNPNSGDHMITASFDEASGMQRAGWSYEGVPFFGCASGTAVRRLYNPNNGLHHFTADAKEAASLAKAGWRDEGTAFHAA